MVNGFSTIIKGIPLRKSFYEMGRMIDDELIVVTENDNPMEELKTTRKKEEKVRAHPRQKNQKVYLTCLNLVEINFFIIKPFLPILIKLLLSIWDE